jgi:hypothetical protein
MTVATTAAPWIIYGSQERAFASLAKINSAMRFTMYIEKCMGEVHQIKLRRMPRQEERLDVSLDSLNN